MRWFPQSALFLCPCHGGAYYADGSLAAGPPPRGLFEHRYKIEDGTLHPRGTAAHAGGARLMRITRTLRAMARGLTAACSSPP